jgi:serine/threonine-protein kinase
VSDPLIGATVGDRYKVVEAIGSGGMASVYRASHLLLHKPVAVKVLHAELSTDATMAARFEGEAVAAARLDHPNIVSITDFGRTADGRMFLVMEYLEGTPLAELVGTDVQLTWPRAVEMTRQILRGLAHAHDMGVVHRDLKPSNIMVVSHPGGREVAKIIDFGIAKIFSGSMAPGAPRVETQAGIVFGTADFLAPERLAGKGESDPRSDLYSVGVILYEALTGARPFHDDDPYRTVERAMTEEPAPASSLVPGVPPALDAVILRALAKEPGARFQTAREMLTALDPLATRKLAPAVGDGLVAPPRAALSLPFGPDDAASASPISIYTPPAVSAPPGRRRSWLVTAGLAAGVGLLIVLVATQGTSSTPLAPPSPLASPAPGPGAARPDDAAEELEEMVKLAGEGETVAERQRAFDRLVALGYGDRVPWVSMLARDLEQLPTCEERREVVAKLRKINDPAVMPHLKQAAARPDNECLAGDARAAIARLEGAPSPSSPPPKKRRSGGGGHF